MASAAPQVSEAPGTPDDFGVLVGWSHVPISHGMQLKMQSVSAEGRQTDRIAARSYHMTRNQAMILAKYLLEATGQTLPPRARGGRMMRFWRRLTGG